MSIVTTFDSDRPSEQVRIPAAGYQDVFLALRVDLDTATTVLARAAKPDLHSILGPLKMMMSSEAHEAGVYPLWFSNISVVVDASITNIEDADTREKWGLSLAKAVEGMADLVTKISRTEPSHDLVIVDPLNIHVTRVGPTLVRFDFKQKWGWQ